MLLSVLVSVLSVLLLLRLHRYCLAGRKGNTDTWKRINKPSNGLTSRSIHSSITDRWYVGHDAGVMVEESLSSRAWSW